MENCSFIYLEKKIQSYHTSDLLESKHMNRKFPVVEEGTKTMENLKTTVLDQQDHPPLVKASADDEGKHFLKVLITSCTLGHFIARCNFCNLWWTSLPWKHLISSSACVSSHNQQHAMEKFHNLIAWENSTLLFLYCVLLVSLEFSILSCRKDNSLTSIHPLLIFVTLVILWSLWNAPPTSDIIHQKFKSLAKEIIAGTGTAPYLTPLVTFLSIFWGFLLSDFFSSTDRDSWTAHKIQDLTGLCIYTVA